MSLLPPAMRSVPPLTIAIRSSTLQQNVPLVIALIIAVHTPAKCKGMPLFILEYRLVHLEDERDFAVRYVKRMLGM